ncbi:MAG: YidC/Oxa1 family membrane protein insertase [Gaiellaceae bacterium]
MSLPLAGILTPIEEPLTDLLIWLHTAIGLSWSWAIVVVVVMVRLVLVPLAVLQVRSMMRLQKHAPELKALQAKYKGDKQRLNEEVMKFYREKKVNPAASCLPILPQIPIFIALFFVLRDFNSEVIAPRFPDSDTSFVRIVPDITDKLLDHWTGPMLLVIYVVSQLVSGLLALRSTPTTDPRQARLQKIMFTVLPFVIIPFAIRFPVGLMIYWITTNLWTAGQGIVTRKLIPRPDSSEPEKRSSRTPTKEELAEEQAAEQEAKQKQPKKKKKDPPAKKKSGSTPKKRRPPAAAGGGSGGGKGGQVKRRKKKGRSRR